ncbi:MAG: D-alanyl-D-alanine carboxypeptidase [Chromatiales bacterium]|nr:D-alanyl-D-alanine carboxypeptidase [Chromatiales bacterium]
MTSSVRDASRRALLALALLVLAPLAGAVVPSAPELEARAYLLLDHNSGRVLVAHNADERLEPASLTKMMTVYVALAEMAAGKIALTDQVRVSEKAWRMQGSRMFIEVGDRVTVEQLLKGVIIQSGNDASVALAEHVAGHETAFSDLMNRHAARLGLTGTHFVNASGLPDPDHYTTAADMAKLGAALIRDFPEHYSWHAIREYEYGGIKQRNRNLLLFDDSAVDGIKTGHTESAGYCLVASAQRDGMRLITVVMGTDSERTRARHSEALLTYGFRFFETRKLQPAMTPVVDVRMWQGEDPNVGLGVAEDLWVTVPRGQGDQVVQSWTLGGAITAPVARGQPFGTLTVSLGEDRLAERALVAVRDVPLGNLWRRASDYVLQLFQ